PENQPAQLRAVAETLAAEAAAFVRRRRGEVFGADAGADGDDAVQTKTTPTDPVTIVDTEAERLLRDRLAQLRSGDAILGAEIGGVSVAGAVADVVGGRLYSAGAGLGAHVTDAEGARRLQCSGIDDLSRALVGTGFAYSGRRRAVQAQLVSRILPMVRDMRRIGSAALDLCMVAAGRLDAYYEHGLHVWDSAAGALIAAEAGARVVLPQPGDPDYNAALVVA